MSEERGPAVGPAARVDPAACSVRSDDVGEGAWGTAPQARFWVALEQPGPWGRVAATESHLDPELGAELERRISAAGGRFGVIRRPGEHADGHQGVVPRTVLVASSVVGAEWLLEGTVEDPTRLLDLDLSAVSAGRADVTADSLPSLSPAAAPVLLVCTNGRRDVCCATRGRPVAAGAAVQRPGRVWESSHLGGHRFAPTAVVLPYGSVFARLDVAQAVDVLDRSGTGTRPPVDLRRHYRGRSALSPAGQVAEAAVLETFAPDSPCGVVIPSRLVEVDGDTWALVGNHAAGAWIAQCRRVVRPEILRPDSCGKDDGAVTEWTVRLHGPGDDVPLPVHLALGRSMLEEAGVPDVEAHLATAARIYRDAASRTPEAGAAGGPSPEADNPTASRHRKRWFSRRHRG